MSKLSSEIKGLIGEYRVASELGRLGFIATTFSKNIKDFDILTTHESNRKTLKIQVKTLTYKPTKTEGKMPKIGYPFKITSFLKIEFDKNKEIQKITGNENYNPNCDYFVFVAINLENKDDYKFFILKPKQLADIIRKDYRNFLNENNGKRPKNWKSKDCRFSPGDPKAEKYEDNDFETFKKLIS